MMKIYTFILISTFSLHIYAETTVAVTAETETGGTATQDSWYGQLKNHLTEVWQKSDQTDLYVPLVTYHNRSMYSREKIDSFNERPWGLGIGKSMRDADSNWDGYYVMAFKDSHDDWEPIVGYGHVKNLAGQASGLNAGLGLTAGFTARSDYNYKPLPVLLPIAAVGYDKVIVNATYVPGTKGNGNVLFMWSTVTF
jgi:lipid IVA palmitoyltransferase